jgi:uncharacterized protein YyaL (SSP411 family)
MIPDGQTANRLIEETSPYLLQHAYNPVDWHPWGKEAFEQAKYENKPLLISIGYSACHWCHVMERESFTDSHIASVMNENFICIKVDREERPDIDQVYMDAVRLINGKGGWPLNCFTLPDGRPFWGGTYFPPDQLLQVLERIAYLWKNKSDDVISQAELLSEGIQEQELNVTNGTVKRNDNTEDVLKTWDALLTNLDRIKGGLKGSPKFPMPVVFSYMLRYAAFSGQKDILNPLWNSLRRMASGGIYDQLGGGFSRYSVDDEWKAPHFEKMLYDNAQLALLYLEGWQVSKDPFYRKIAEETLGFVKRELLSPEGAFLSSFDADSEGKEGHFYLWDEEEMQRLLGPDAALIIRYYGVGTSGLWEHGRSILLRPLDEESFLISEGLEASEWALKLEKAKKILLGCRTMRISPELDDKVLTSWNALMLKTFAEASIALDNEEYLQIAERNAHFILDKMMDTDGRLLHSWKNGKAKINGFLEDYAYSIDAFISLYQSTFHLPYLLQARDSAHYAIEHFYDEEKGLFFFTSDEDTPLVARLFELNDGVMPSPNSVMARSLLRLAVYFEKGRYRETAQRAFEIMGDLPIKYSTAFTNWSILRLEIVKGPVSAVFVGKDYLNLRKKLGQSFLPFAVMAGYSPELPLSAFHNQQDKENVFVCTGNNCYPSTDSIEEIEQMLNSVN